MLPWTYVIEKHNGEKNVGIFYGTEIQQQQQQQQQQQIQIELRWYCAQDLFELQIPVTTGGCEYLACEGVT